MIFKISDAYKSLIHFGEIFQSPILLLCRLYWGWHFATGGFEKLNDISHFIQLLSTYHFPAPVFLAYLVGCCEFLGGICLVIGFVSRLAALPLIFIMIAAYLTVHVGSLQNFFHDPSLFVAEGPFNFLLICFFVLAFGPGCFSIDYVIKKMYDKKHSGSSVSY